MKKRIEIIRISKEVSMALLFAVLLMSMLATSAAFASSSGSGGGSGGGSSGGSGSHGGSGSSGSGAPTPAYSVYSTRGTSGNSSNYVQAINNGGGRVVETFRSGNVAVSQSRNFFAESAGGTASYRNADGTYNTITVSSGGGSSGGSSSDGSGNGGYSGPVSGGTGGSTGGGGAGGYYENRCTSSGKGGCVYTPVWVPYPAPAAPQASAPAQQQASVAPVVDISTSPSIIRAGGSSRVTWSGGAADECTVSGPGLSSGAINGSQVVDGIQEQSTYTLTCSSGTAVAQDTARVDIVPLWREI